MTLYMMEFVEIDMNRIMYITMSYNVNQLSASHDIVVSRSIICLEPV